jgi:putative transposase
MSDLTFIVLRSLCSLRTQAALKAEIIALRHQVIVLQRTQKTKRPLLRPSDRWLWVWLSRIWSGWRSALMIVKPETVVNWHRKGFRWYWTWKIRRGETGRPSIPKETRDLIRTISRMNVLWGAPRIRSELLKIGIKVSQATVAKYMVRHPKPPSQTWRTFLANHVSQLASVDFFTVPTIWFGILFVFVVLAHDRRRILHFNVTAHPTAAWTAQQIIEAFPFDTAPKYLLRDRDRIYGYEFRKQLEVMDIEEVLSAPRSPWQRAYIERLIGSIRRECLDHMIVFNEESLRHLLRAYVHYYHSTRLHLSLERDAPDHRPVQSDGKIVAMSQVGGLHYRYERDAASIGLRLLIFWLSWPSFPQSGDARWR